MGPKSFMKGIPLAEVPENIILPQVSLNIVYPDGAQKWEYMALSNSGLLTVFIQELNKLGAEGWQVCEKLSDYNYLLIRQINSPESEIATNSRPFEGRQFDVEEEPGE